MPNTAVLLEHGFAAACALAGGVAGFSIGARVEGFSLALIMGINAAVCAALLAVSLVDVAGRLLRRRPRGRAVAPDA
ncbi:MAG: hypothetical protein JNN03_04615 [Rubrivivax sp.]|nr:hypothetical protein [Rubrivivax sp.]